MYPESKVANNRDQCLIWRHTIRPSPMSMSYDIELVYNLRESPKVYVVNPRPLILAEGKSKLPHCYDQKLQHLCLFYPHSNEWNKSKLLINTVIPWTYEWLYHYEIWLGNGGDWKGGGRHPIIHNNKKGDL